MSNRSKKAETNIQFIKRLMEFSDNGAMMQAVIIEALSQYADNIVMNETSFIQAMKDNPLINPHAWVSTCKELKKELDSKYNKSND